MQWKIGDVTVTKVVELESTIDSPALMPQATPEAILAIPWLRPHFADDRGLMRLSIHSFIVQTPERRIVVDTCLGNDKTERLVPAWNNRHGAYLEDLTAAGFPPESIDTVLCTHLHVDHIGWNTRLVDRKWVPTFPRAQYLIGREEFDFWRVTNDPPHIPHVLGDSVTPVMDAGLAVLVETDAVIAPGIRLVPTPGHTPGHVSVVVESRGETALITGDFMYHPSQIAHPDWSTLADTDQQQGIATRLRMFEALAGTPTLVLGTHFAGVTAGRIVRDGETFRLDV